MRTTLCGEFRDLLGIYVWFGYNNIPQIDVTNPKCNYSKSFQLVSAQPIACVSHHPLYCNTRSGEYILDGIIVIAIDPSCICCWHIQICVSYANHSLYVNISTAPHKMAIVIPGILREDVKSFDTLRPTQIGRHFSDDIFKCIFLKENVWILLKISLVYSSGSN